MMRRSVLNTKGQATIPVELRQQLEIKPGTRVHGSEEQGRLVMAPMTLRRMNEIRGFLRPKAGPPSAFDELFAERERERRGEKS
jgi:bifunctional DNA-binding transcriptional regulator/antitoxin component of YhaV-PrlF toxin-antitoxin module